MTRSSTDYRVEARAAVVFCWAGLSRFAELGATGAGVGEGTPVAGVDGPGAAWVGAAWDGAMLAGAAECVIEAECDPPQLHELVATGPEEEATEPTPPQLEHPPSQPESQPLLHPHPPS